jgi:hypothetical protein
MMNDVRINDAVEEVAADKSKIPIDGGQRALHKGPRICIVMVQVFMSVV